MPPKIQQRKQGLFDDIRRRPSREVRAPPSSPIQFDRQNANPEWLQRSEFPNVDPRRWSITSNAGSDDSDREEVFQLAYFLFSELRTCFFLYYNLAKEFNFSFRGKNQFPKSDTKVSAPAV